MALTTTDFSLIEHMRVRAWNARCPSGLDARTVLNHPMTEEVIMVFYLASNIPLWSIVPLRDGMVVLSSAFELGSGLLMRMTTDALEMIEVLSNQN